MLTSVAANGPDGAVTGPGGQPGGAGPARLLAVAADLDQAVAAVLAGADLIDLAAPADGSASPDDPDDPARAAIAGLRARCPGVLVCAAGPGADLVRDPAVARVTGALLICADQDAAGASGLPAGRVIVGVTPGEVAEAARAGWATLVDADAAGDGEPDGRTAPRSRSAPRSRTAPRSRIAPASRTAPGVLAPGQDALAGVVAAAAIGCWLGANLVRTRHVRTVRRALDMAEVIRGTRLPARTVRGLA
jgi:hypothetical protein